MLHIKRPETRRRRKRYLLINPPIEEPYRKEVTEADSDSPGLRGYAGRQYTYPLPIGLLRIAGQLLRAGNEVYFLDAFSALPKAYPSSRERRSPSDEPDFLLTDRYRVRYFHLGLPYHEIDKLLAEVTVDEIFVGCTFTYHNKPAHKVIELCKERMPQTPVTFGGIYPTLAPEVAKTSRADEVFTGPYPGIEDQSLDYDFLGGPPDFILIKGTSGCPHHCAYCAVHKLEGHRFSHRDPAEVFAEIRRAHERYGLAEVGMWDSNILMQYDDYLGAILKQIIDSDLTFRMAAPEGFDYRVLTPEIAQTLKAAGFRRISLALENADDTYAREELNRSNRIGQFKDAIGYLREAGFSGPNIRIFIIVGLPGQPIRNVIDSIRFVWSLGCNVTLFPLTPIPGTALYESYAERLGGLPLRALHPSLYSCVDEDETTDMLVDLASLGRLSRSGKSQAEHFREVISSEELVGMLA